ncbi:hypothetical protein [Shouchella patagoniensis]|uniref:hypothetical protein n=1 Tax=Shouchella patagoniensis TaxID=228576 RepID=UPI000995B0D9|nr:hypothetical protein [Shouchella patagoniensis]
MNDQNELEKNIIASFKQDEAMMILVFAQWCVNSDLDPKTLYFEAYPHQAENEELNRALELTVSKEESEPIASETVLQVLQLFGNEDLAFVVSSYANK